MSGLNFAALAGDFELMKQQWAGVAEVAGSRLRVATCGVESAWIESTLPKVRRLMVQVQGVGAFPRIVAKEYPSRWPAVPQATSNLGFLVTSQAHAVVYVHSDGGCFEGYREHADHFTALMIAEDGTYFEVGGAPLFRRDGELMRLRQSPAVVVKFELPAGRRIEALPVARGVRVAEAVFALGQNQAQWVISPGQILESGTDEATVSTTCECFHGFCGAPLVNAAGELVGFGARIAYEDYVTGRPAVRRYGIGRFSRLSHLLADVVDFR